MSSFTITGSRNPDDGMNPSRRLYRKPVLEKPGDLRTMTLGGSPGAGDSGGGLETELLFRGSSPIFPDIPDEFKLPDDQYIPPL